MATIKWSSAKDEWGTTTHIATIDGRRVGEAYRTGSRLETSAWHWKAFDSRASGDGSSLYTCKRALEAAITKEEGAR